MKKLILILFSIVSTSLFVINPLSAQEMEYETYSLSGFNIFADSQDEYDISNLLPENTPVEILTYRYTEENSSVSITWQERWQAVMYQDILCYHITILQMNQSAAPSEYLELYLDAENLTPYYFQINNGTNIISQTPDGQEILNYIQYINVLLRFFPFEENMDMIDLMLNIYGEQVIETEIFTVENNLSRAIQYELDNISGLMQAGISEDTRINRLVVQTPITNANRFNTAIMLWYLDDQPHWLVKVKGPNSDVQLISIEYE